MDAAACTSQCIATERFFFLRFAGMFGMDVGEHNLSAHWISGEMEAIRF